jgi:hypothetical protein
MIPYRRKPSVGFVYLLLVVIATAAFFTWGLARPRLEEAWRLDIELGLGKRPPLSKAEMGRLQATLVAHPAVAEFLSEDKHAGVFSANDDGKIEGDYAYLVRQQASDPGVLSVTYAGARKKGAVSVSARTLHAHANGGVRRFKPWTWRLPDDGPFPQLVEIRLTPAPDQKQLHPVRIDVRGAP